MIFVLHQETSFNIHKQIYIYIINTVSRLKNFHQCSSSSFSLILKVHTYLQLIQFCFFFNFKTNIIHIIYFRVYSYYLIKVGYHHRQKIMTTHHIISYFCIKYYYFQHIVKNHYYSIIFHYLHFHFHHHHHYYFLNHKIIIIFIIFVIYYLFKIYY